jgi:hypothetical protein
MASGEDGEELLERPKRALNLSTALALMARRSRRRSLAAQRGSYGSARESMMMDDGGGEESLVVGISMASK